MSRKWGWGKKFGKRWGKKIHVKTLKHMFCKHFIFRGRDVWHLNPNDKEKVRKRVIPTLRMIMSWRYKDIDKDTDQEIVEKFLGIIKWDHPDVYESGKVQMNN